VDSDFQSRLHLSGILSENITPPEDFGRQWTYSRVTGQVTWTPPLANLWIRCGRVRIFDGLLLSNGSYHGDRSSQVRAIQTQRTRRLDMATKKIRVRRSRWGTKDLADRIVRLAKKN
jgi:hypothetical protein